MKLARNVKTLICLAVLVSHSNVANASQSEKPRKPPEEAIAACVDKKQGDKVTFNGRKGEQLKARCKLVGDLLAAVPVGHKHKKRQD